MKLLKTNSDHLDFRQLVSFLDAHLSVLNGEDDAFYAQYNHLNVIKHVIIAYIEEKPVGCGAIKAYSDESMEIKRMYVLPEHRGRGIATQILNELEDWAKELGYHSTVLETLKTQENVVKVYAKNGYKVIPNYGQYVGMETSICMKKSIINPHLLPTFFN
jgi:putative acetyltransferase